MKDWLDSFPTNGLKPNIDDKRVRYGHHLKMKYWPDLLWVILNIPVLIWEELSFHFCWPDPPGSYNRQGHSQPDHPRQAKTLPMSTQICEKPVLLFSFLYDGVYLIKLRRFFFALFMTNFWSLFYDPIYYSPLFILREFF